MAAKQILFGAPAHARLVRSLNCMIAQLPEKPIQEAPVDDMA